MSLDPSLAAQRQMIRDQWERDAAMTRAALRQAPPAGLQAPDEQEDISGAPHDRGEDLLAEQQAQQDPMPETDGRSEPGPRGTPRISAPVRWECPEGIADGQREVLQLVHWGRVDLAAVLRSRDRDAKALSVRHVLEADRRIGPARAGQVMAGARTGDGAVSQLAPVHIERLLAAAASLP